MNDEKFQEDTEALRRGGYVSLVDDLRARDTAQREALARVEAERDEAREFMRINAKSGMTYAEQRDIAQAQLAEAVVLLKEVGAYFGWVPMPSLVGNIANFLARHAQAEQQDVPKRGKPDWNSHGYDQIFQTSDGNWFGARAGWDFKGHISGGWKGREVSLLRDDGGFLAYGESNPNWENSLEQRPAQEAQGAQAGDGRAALQSYLAGIDFPVSSNARAHATLAFEAGWQARAAQADPLSAEMRALELMQTWTGEDWSEMAERFPALAEQIEGARRDALATQPAEQLWAVHAQGPDDLYAAYSREEADAHAAALNAIPCPPGINVSAVVIESPWPAAEHWKYLVEQDREHNNTAVRGADHE